MAKAPMTEEMREFFRKMGKRGIRKRNKNVTKAQRVAWGTKAAQVTTPAQREQWGKEGAKASAAARKKKA